MEWLVSVVCEAFECLPSEALRELEEAPAGLIWRVIKVRSFAQAKKEMDDHKRNPKSPLKETTMTRQVRQTQVRIGREKRRAADWEVADERDEHGGGDQGR